MCCKDCKKIVDDKAKYTDWSTRDDIKAELQADLAIVLDANGYPPVAIDEAYKEVLEQAENFRKYAGWRERLYGNAISMEKL